MRDKRLSAQIFTMRDHAYKVLGWSYKSPGIAPLGLNAIRAYGLLYSKAGYFQSHGSLHGAGYGEQGFSLADVTAPPLPEDEDGYAGFSGVVLSLDNLAKQALSFGSRVIIRRDRKFLNARSVQDMKRVGLVDREFERSFEVYSDDQTEARALITPDLWNV